MSRWTHTEIHRSCSADLRTCASKFRSREKELKIRIGTYPKIKLSAQNRPEIESPPK